MDVWSTVFEETCGFINGVGGCTIVVGSHHGGAVANTPPTTPTSTHVTPSFTTSTHASTSPSQMPKPVSPSSTQPLPSPTPPSASPTAGVAPPDPPRSDSSTPRASNTFSASSLTPNPGITTNVTVTITSAPSLATPTLEPDTSDANTSAASSVSATPSTLSPSPTTSFLPLSTPSACSGSQLPAAAIAGIAVGAGAISLVLLAGCIWWVARRRRLPPTVAGSSTPQAGVSDASILSRAISTTTTRRTLLQVPIENEGEKGEYSLRSSSETLQGSVRVDRSESMVVEASNFESDECSRSPPSRSLAMETVPFLAAPSLSGKGIREAASTSTITDIAFNPATTEATTVVRQSTAEMEGGARTHCHLWNGDANEDGDADVEGSGRTFRYETDAGMRLDGGPLGELREYEDSDYDQRTIASVVTAPPPYSRY